MSENKFTLGTCNQNGKDYRFDYDNGKYFIFLVKEESAELLETESDKFEAYKKWNEIKRPEKSRKV